MIKKLITLFLPLTLCLPGVAQSGAALHFDGIDDIVSIPVDPAFDFTTGTAECWFNSDVSFGNTCVLAMRTNTSGARWSIHTNEYNNELGFYNGASFSALPVNINPNTWYHLAVVMSSTNAVFYLNGMNVGTVALGMQTSSTGLPFTIGGHSDAAWPEHFLGSIDEVRIWNRALCISEITSCMTGEAPAFSNGLVADYHFNQGVAAANNAGITTLTDASGNNRNGTLQNFALNGTYSNWLAPGGVTSGSSATPAIPTSISATTHISCNGGNNGSATVTATGVGPFTYSWAPIGGSSATATGLAAGTYSCTVSNGCASSVATVTITQPAPISFSAVVTHISCSSSNDGAINLTVTGGTGPFSYDWSFGYTTEDISGLYPGTYAVTVTDANGCTASSSQFSVSYASTLSSSVTVAPFPCTGGTTTATMTPTGGTAPYTYSWSPSGGNGATSTPIGPGTYYCTVTDANGCVSSRSFTITQPAPLTASATITSNYNGFPISCDGMCDGQLTAVVSGGSGPYTYQWSNGMITQIATGVCMGAYTYTVTDVAGCSATANVMVMPPAPLYAAITATNVSCNGNSNGAINMTMSGGAGGYSYSWSNSATTEDINGLAPGTYSVTIADVNGCTTTASATITQPPVLTSSSSATSITCNGGTATVTVTGSGGTSPYSGAGTFTVTAGNYSYPVTDANGCTTTTSITVTEPTVLTSASSSTAILCNGGTATVMVTGSGGTSPYSGAGTFTVTAGNYSYPVTDANGCTSTTSITVTEPTALTSASSSTAILCNGGTATVTVTGAGGTAPYTGEGTFTEIAGTYSYTVTDVNGCTSTTTITITEPTALTAASSATAILCNGGAATVTVTGAGGTAPYTGEGTFTEIAGTYSYTVTDVNGCTSTTLITVAEPAVLSASVINAVNPTTCSGTDGSIDIDVTGGTMVYSFLWSNSDVTEDLTAIGAGSYSVTVTDANGCTATATASVNDPGAPTVTLALPIDTVCGDFPGLINLSGEPPSGGTFSGTAVSGNTFDPFAAGTGLHYITYTFTDINGCTGSTTDSILVDGCMGFEAATATSWNLFPNPTNGAINITTTAELNSDVIVEIYSVDGKLIQSEKKQQVQTITLDLTNEPVGVYFICITANGNTGMHRVVKM